MSKEKVMKKSIYIYIVRVSLFQHRLGKRTRRCTLRLATESRNGRWRERVSDRVSISVVRIFKLFFSFFYFAVQLAVYGERGRAYRTARIYIVAARGEEEGMHVCERQTPDSRITAVRLTAKRATPKYSHVGTLIEQRS